MSTQTQQKLNVFAPAAQPTSLDRLVASATRQLRAEGGSAFVAPELASGALAMESADPVLRERLGEASMNLSAALEGICAEADVRSSSLSKTQRAAAIMGGVFSGSPSTFMRRPQKTVQLSGNDRFIEATGGVERMQAAMEAYDERENKNSAVYSVVYNMQAARQDDFGEALYPTVVVTPDQVGYTVSIHLVTVYEEVRRNISGNVDSFNRKNIVHAVRDASILASEQTKLIPVYRTESQDKFMPTSLLATSTVMNAGESITTSALVFGKTLSLLGISQTDAQIQQGLQDSTDAIDTDIVLSNLYLVLDGTTDEVIRIPTAKLDRANFVAALQGSYRAMNLNFVTKSLRIDKNTKTAAGSASTILAPVVSGEYVVKLAVSVSGSVDMQTADTQLMAGAVEVVSVTDNSGVEHAPTSSTVASIVALFNNAKLGGYDLDARRTNSNRRSRGQLLDTMIYNQIYAVPLLAPITIPRPMGQGDNTDASDLAALITATRIKASNSAVTELLRAAGTLATFASNSGQVGDSPEVLGVARFLVTPFYEFTDLNVAAKIDSIKSHERAEDIQGVLVNSLRDVIYRAYTNSGYKAAADALSGGAAPSPTVIIATDPVIARYLMVTGDLRLVGSDFNIKVVSTLDTRMTGKMFATFGNFESAQEGVPNPMHFGNMAWKPELTLVLPLHRNGANSKELTVQPSFKHITNLPVLAEWKVSGIPAVAADKVTSNWHEQP